ncbi:MAG TPA: ChuX/HutX family heme-like substrate-binding protein [Polyangia bacterium]|nr:ChuX/HutX family heme-like substrate-binding protein [Polyangia bacterium]
MTEQTTVGSPGNGAGATGNLGGHERSREQREIAARRGLSEGALVEARVGGQVVRLRTDWPLTLHRLGAVGPVIGLTCNQLATIETVAIYRNIATRGPAAQISDLQTDLCLFLSEWRTGFAVTEERGSDKDPQRSLQFFDARGIAVHKVLLPAGGDTDAFDELVRRQASGNQRPIAEGEAVAVASATDPTGSPKPGAGRDAPLPMIHSIDTASAHPFAGPMWSRRVAKESLGHVLETAIAAEMPLLVMVGNRGAIHNHAGPLRELRRLDSWLTIRDPNLNLHIDGSGVESAWVVRKATPDGVVTSLELYDRGGEMIVYLARL